VLDSSITNLAFAVPTAKTITLKSEDVADLPGLAAKHLGSRYLWYTLLHYNGLYDSITDLYAGMVLKIPEQAALVAYLKKSGVSGGVNTTQIIV
jgi:hypothetical protein